MLAIGIMLIVFGLILVLVSSMGVSCYTPSDPSESKGGSYWFLFLVLTGAIGCIVVGGSIVGYYFYMNH